MRTVILISFILVDSANKYYTGRYDFPWSTDRSEAYNFLDEQEIEKMLMINQSMPEEILEGRLEGAIFPIHSEKLYNKTLTK